MNEAYLSCRIMCLHSVSALAQLIVLKPVRAKHAEFVSAMKKKEERRSFGDRRCNGVTHFKVCETAVRTKADVVHELLERQLHRSEQNERQLRLEAAYLASPARVGERAAAELGMGSPTLAQLVFAGEAR